jgi:hypothetical protein
VTVAHSATVAESDSPVGDPAPRGRRISVPSGSYKVMPDDHIIIGMPGNIWFHQERAIAMI